MTRENRFQILSKKMEPIFCKALKGRRDEAVLLFSPLQAGTEVWKIEREGDGCGSL